MLKLKLGGHLSLTNTCSWVFCGMAAETTGYLPMTPNLALSWRRRSDLTQRGCDHCPPSPCGTRMLPFPLSWRVAASLAGLLRGLE